MIQNPILPGFHPDPSILRVGQDFYVATSTFEWFPGVRLHHSRDLQHFRPLGFALTRPSQLELRGNPRSGGVWAPCLSYKQGRFYLVYTDVKAWGRGFVDAHNYFVTADSIEGPWSEPQYLNSTGFDPSLFHDEDGRTWLVNMVWEHRPGHNQFGGIVLQELSEASGRLLGEPQLIFRGTQLGCTEGPHLYRRNGYYYLMTAEGGTSYEHAVTLARSKTIDGPYQVHPGNPILTSRHDPSLALQKAGHACLVETEGGEAYLAHLCGRPLGPARRCVLGRETALQRVRWTADDWLILDTDGDEDPRAPKLRVRAPALPASPLPAPPVRDDFERLALGPDYQTLRDPADESWLTLRERPGFLRLRGRESPQSLHRQSVVGRRLTSHFCRLETAFEFAARSPQQGAGLALFYDDDNFFSAQIAGDERLGRSIGLLCSYHGKLGAPAPRFAVPAGRIWVRALVAGVSLSFSYSTDGEQFTPLGPPLDMTQLSDETTTLGLGFTGTFVTLSAYDLTGAHLPADFDYLDYEDLPPAPRV